MAGGAWKGGYAYVGMPMWVCLCGYANDCGYANAGMPCGYAYVGMPMWVCLCGGVDPRTRQATRRESSRT